MWELLSEGLENTLKEAKATKEKATQKAKDLEYKLKNAKALREQELKQAEADVAKARKEMEASKKKMKEKKQVCIPESTNRTSLAKVLCLS